MYFVVANIPATFHSKDLRNYFSFFTEQNAFECFHYCHRRTLSFLKFLQENQQIFLNHHCHECTSDDQAEVFSFFYKDLINFQKPELSENKKKQFIYKTTLNIQNLNLNQTTLQDCFEEDFGYCCFAKVKYEFSKDFKSIYNGKCWVAYSGEVFPTKCTVFNIDSLIHAHKVHAIAQDKVTSNYQYCSKSKPGHEINLSKIEKLKEFQMGLELPCGNIGTSSAFFKSQLQLCKLPSSLIKKLGLDFQPKISKKCQNQVHLDYGTTVRPVPEIDQSSCNFSNMIFTSTGQLIPGYFDVKFNKNLDKTLIKPTLPIIETTSGNLSDDEVEKWDKYDVVYEDQRHREKSKDKLFESEMEQVWEKGGSGLVFWTDAQFWRVEDNESEESDADDWDLTGDNDMDAQDKTSINTLHDVKLNPGSHSVFDKKSIYKTKRNKYVNFQKKIYKSTFDNQKEDLKLPSISQVKKKLKKVTKLDSSDGSSKKEKNSQERAGDKRITVDLFNFKQNYSVKKKKIFEGNSMEYGEFEKYSKGIGSRLLKSQGWQQGEGLGKNSNGIIHPVNLCPVAKRHMKKEGIGFYNSEAKKLKDKPISSKSNKLPEVLEKTIENIYEPMKSNAPLMLMNSNFIDYSISGLKFKEHNLKVKNSQVRSEINLNDSKNLHDLNIYPHCIQFQKASKGS